MTPKHITRMFLFCQCIKHEKAFCKVYFGTPLPIFAFFDNLTWGKLCAASLTANHFDNFYIPPDSSCCGDYRKLKLLALALFSGFPEAFIWRKTEKVSCPTLRHQKAHKLSYYWKQNHVTPFFNTSCIFIWNFGPIHQKSKKIHTPSQILGIFALENFLKGPVKTSLCDSILLIF